MKAAVGSVVIVACVFGVAGWLLLVRWHSVPEPAVAADPCGLAEVACTATSAGRVVHATFPSVEASGDSRAAELSVSCVGPLWDVGILFPESLPSGWYVVRWESLAVASAPDPGEWSASRGFLSSREPERFVDVVLGRVPLSGGFSWRRSGRLRRSCSASAAARGSRRRSPSTRFASARWCARSPAAAAGGRPPMDERALEIAGALLLGLVVSGLLLALYLVAASGAPRGRRRRRRRR